VTAVGTCSSISNVIAPDTSLFRQLARRHAAPFVYKGFVRPDRRVNVGSVVIVIGQGGIDLGESPRFRRH
jgi:hypothetical protein